MSGTLDLFITFTCTPTWSEIQHNLLNGQARTDRHDIVARVLKLKVGKLMDSISKGEIFGAKRCHMYRIEWQKRGFPHTDLLTWLKDRINPNEIDSFICI